MTQATGTPSTLSLSRIGQIAVRVHDLDRAIPFYRDVLGIPFLFRAGNLAFLDCSGTRLLLDIPEDREFDHPSSAIYFTVDDIQQAYSTLLQRGVTFRGEPHLIARLADREVWMAFFFDTEANTHALMSEVPHA